MQESFNFSEEIDGSATEYSITYSYTTSSSQEICETVNISSSSFNEGYFTHTFKVFSSSCHSGDHIVVTVLATNALGDGPSTSSVIGLQTFNVTKSS